MFYFTGGKILRDIVYIGDMENHKYEVKNYKTKKRTRVPKEEHIIVRNTHEPIISRSDFEHVQELIRLDNVHLDITIQIYLKEFLDVRIVGGL